MSYTVPVYSATIEAELLAKEIYADSNSFHISKYKLLRNFKRQFTVFYCLGLGVLFSFISWLHSVLNPVPEMYNLVLFGIKYFAILIIFYGLYCLFE